MTCDPNCTALKLERALEVELEWDLNPRDVESLPLELPDRRPDGGDYVHCGERGLPLRTHVEHLDRWLGIAIQLLLW